MDTQIQACTPLCIGNLRNSVQTGLLHVRDDASVMHHPWCN